VVPSYVKDPPQAPFIQCINLSGVSFRQSPALRSATEQLNVFEYW